MQIRYVLAMSFGMRIGIVLLCMSFLYANRLLGQSYFSSLMTAAQQKDAVRRAFDRDQRNDLGLTGLMYAAINGQLDLAKALFKYGATLNLGSTKENQTALHFATNNMRSLGSQNIGYYLISVFADTMVRNMFGQIPLHLVISTDTIEDRTRMVEDLLKNGSNMNAQTNQGDTLLHLAVNLKNDAWVETLLEKWSSIINLSIKNKKGLTPRQYAKQLGYGYLADTVFAKSYPKITGAAQRGPNGLTGLMLAIMRADQKAIVSMVKDKKSLNLLSDDSYQNSALHVALVRQNIPAVATLIKAGANVVIQNANKEVPAHYLVRVWDIKKKRKVMPLVLNKAPSAILIQNKNGNTLLHYIVQYNDTPLLNFLIKNHKPLLKKAIVIKNKSLLSPINLADKLNRTKMRATLARLIR